MTATALQRLLKHPHPAVFDKTAKAEPVMRVRSEAGLAWAVADEVLTLTSGDRVLRYELATLTVGQLAAAMAQDGIEVGPLAPEFAGLSATVLVEGKGDQATSNGDRLSGFKNPLWSLYAAFAPELRLAGEQVRQALRQMVITQAEGEWLDLWGTLYGIGRGEDEADADYAPRIPEEAFRLRVNALAIEKAILDATGKVVRIEEPWGSLFRLDESALSGESRFYDGSHVGYHLIRPVSQSSIDWTEVLAVIERNRAAGVIVLPPETRLGSLIDAHVDGTIWFGCNSISSSFVPLWIDSRLDYMVLSAEEITRNYDVMISQIITLANFDPLLDPESISRRRTVARASIALSDGPPLGDENAIFPRAELTQKGRLLSLSDDAELSSLGHKPVYKPVDRVTTQFNGFGKLVMADQYNAGKVSCSTVVGAEVEAIVEGTINYAGEILRSTDMLAPTPVVASVFAWGNSGLTWATAGTWGPFPWGGETQTDIVSVSGTIEVAVGLHDIDILEVKPQ